jgi:hypothetical protein
VPIHGTIEEAGLPDVLQLLSLGRKSGCLSVAHGDTHGEIYLDVGRISYASVANRDRLGELLVKNGRITREQLNVATAEQARGSDRQIGRILLASGSVERSEIEKFVRHQVEEAVYLLFAWKQGSFTFTSDQQPTRGALLVSLDPAGLLLEGARRVDEWEQIAKKIPSFDLVYQRTKARTSGEIADDLTEDQKRLLPLLDGTRDVTGVMDTTAMSEFEVGKALYGLIVAGIVRLVERRAQVRHLDYRELLAYVVREAELADPQRRKQAARHIVDCPDCSARLRTIHVRRTEGRPAIADEPPPQTPAHVAIEYLKSISPVRESLITLAPEPFEPDDIIEGRLEAEAPKARGERRESGPKPETPEQRQQREQERRAGRERRQRERRANADRRARQGAARGASLVERRRAPRRSSERDDTYAWDRRAFNRRGGSVAVSTTQPRSLPARHTEARRIPALARAESVPDSIPETRPEAPQPEQRAAAATAEPQVQPAAQPLQSELPWLMSPDQSLVLVRQSWQHLPVGGSGASAPRATPTPPALPPIRPPAVAMTRAEVPAPVPALVPLGTAPPAPAAAMRTGNGAAHHAPAPKGVFIPMRHIVVATTIAGVALLSYLAGSSRARGGVGSAPETAAASAPTQVPPVAAAPPPRAAPAAPLSAQNPPRNASTPAVLPAPAAPAAVRPPSSGGLGIVRGSVRDGAGRPIIGATISVRGTSLTATADRFGNFELREVADGAGVLETTAQGYIASTTDFRARAGAASMATIVLGALPGAAPAPAATAAAATPPAAAPTPAPAPAAAAPAPAPTITAAAPAEPDRELASGGWAAVDRAEAATVMGGTIGAIQGLPIESITRSLTGSRPRVRVVQLTAAGERIVLTETRSGTPTRAPGPAVVNAVRVMPASEAYPFATGTVSLGNLLVTAKTSIAAEALRPLLERMGEIQ